MRALDVGYSFAFDIGQPSRTAGVSFSNVYSGFEAYRSLTVFQFKPGTVGGAAPDAFQTNIQESGPPSLVHQNIFDGVDDGAEGCNDGTNTLLAIPFTQPVVAGDAAPLASLLWLSRVGNPVGTPARMEVSIHPDAAGSPGAPLGPSYYIDVRDIGATITPVLFSQRDFAVGLPAGDYWLVIVGFYNADALNHVRVHYNTVPGTSGCLKNPGWVPIPNEDFWFKHFQLEFTDVPAAEIEGGDLEPYTNGQLFLNAIDSAQSRVLDLSRRKQYLRCKHTVTGAAAWFPLVFGTAAYPHTPPARPDVLDYTEFP